MFKNTSSGITVIRLFYTHSNFFFHSPFISLELNQNYTVIIRLIISFLTAFPTVNVDVRLIKAAWSLLDVFPVTGVSIIFCFMSLFYFSHPHLSHPRGYILSPQG